MTGEEDERGGGPPTRAEVVGQPEGVDVLVPLLEVRDVRGQDEVLEHLDEGLRIRATLLVPEAEGVADLVLDDPYLDAPPFPPRGHIP